jgi:small subunit ribosomal protein S15e
MSGADKKKDKMINKYSFRGKTIDELEKLPQSELVALFRARQRRRFARRMPQRYEQLLNKCRRAKKNCVPGEKPKPVKTHLRNAIVMPEMVGGIVAVYNGRVFNPIEIKFDMIGKYLGEFSLSYKPTRHGRPGVGATKGSSASALK